jgi:hypothetical protein
LSVVSSLSVIVGATTKPLEKGLKKASSAVQGFSKSASSAIAGPGGIGGAIAGAVAGVSVTAAFKFALDKFSAVEQASLKLSTALKATGGTAGVSAGEVTRFAQQMAQTTRFGATGASLRLSACDLHVLGRKIPVHHNVNDSNTFRPDRLLQRPTLTAKSHQRLKVCFQHRQSSQVAPIKEKRPVTTSIPDVLSKNRKNDGTRFTYCFASL